MLMRPDVARHIVERRVGDFVMTIGEFTPRTNYGRMVFAWSSIEVLLSGKLIEERRGAVRTLTPGSVYSYPRRGERLKIDQINPIVIFNIRLLPGDLEAVDPDTLHATARLNRTALMWRAFRELAAWSDASSDIVLESIAYQLAREDDADKSARVPRWCKDIAEIVASADSSPSLRALADHAGVHPCHLARAFKAAFGCTVGECHRAHRMLRAVQRLTRARDNIAQIALSAGFSDHAHFTREFRRMLGCAPTALRSDLRRVAGRCAFS